MITRFIRRGSLIVLLAHLIEPGLGGEAPPDGGGSWERLLNEKPADLDAGRWHRLMNAMKANGLSGEAAHDCLAPVAEAARQGLPSDAVLVRLEEGAAKKAGANILLQAGQARLATLRTAAEVLKETGYGARKTENDNLLKTVALALESGLEAKTVNLVLARGNGSQSDRIQSIIEAGETMRLNDMDDATVGPMMADFIDRNLRRSEVVRASRFAIQQHKAHVDGDRIRQRLWGQECAGGNGDVGAGKRQVVAPRNQADASPGQGPVHVDPAGTGTAGPKHVDGPNRAPGPGAPGTEQLRRRQNGRSQA